MRGAARNPLSVNDLEGYIVALVIVSRVLSRVLLRVDLSEQLLHFLGGGVELPCAGAVLK